MDKPVTIKRAGTRLSSPSAMRRRANAEQRMAFAELKAWAAPVGLRVKRDEEGLPIPGRLGQIEWTGGPQLAVYSDHPRVFPKLFAVDGITRKQIGDTEIRLLFPPAALPQIAQVIRAHRKPGCVQHGPARWVRRRLSRPLQRARRPPRWQGWTRLGAAKMTPSKPLAKAVMRSAFADVEGGTRVSGQGVVQVRGILAERVVMSVPLDPFLTPRALASYGGIGLRKLRDHLSDPAHPLPCYRIGGKIVVRRSEFDAWIAVYRQKGRESVNTIVDDVMRELGGRH